MNSEQTEFLALGGPAHLSVVTIPDGSPTHIVPVPVKEGETVQQTFIYRRVPVGAGSGRPIEFLVPAHLDGKPKDLAAWVFNKMCQALMSPHPLAGHVLLGLGFIVRDRDGGLVRVITAEARAHAVSRNGVIGLQPVAVTDNSAMLDAELLRHPHATESQKHAALRALDGAVRPFLAKTVDHVAKHEKW